MVIGGLMATDWAFHYFYLHSMFNHIDLVETTNQLPGFCVLTLLAIYEKRENGAQRLHHILWKLFFGPKVWCMRATVCLGWWFLVDGGFEWRSFDWSYLQAAEVTISLIITKLWNLLFFVEFSYWLRENCVGGLGSSSNQELPRRGAFASFHFARWRNGWQAHLFPNSHAL